MSAPEEFKKTVTITWGALVFAVAFLISTTFSATTIYFQFNQTKEHLDLLQTEIDYINGRLDRKVGRVEEKVVQLEKDVASLQQKHPE